MGLVRMMLERLTSVFVPPSAPTARLRPDSGRRNARLAGARVMREADDGGESNWGLARDFWAAAYAAIDG